MDLKKRVEILEGRVYWLERELDGLKMHVQHDMYMRQNDSQMVAEPLADSPSATPIDFSQQQTHPATAPASTFEQAPQWQHSGGAHPGGHHMGGYSPESNRQAAPKRDWEREIASIWLPRVFIVVLLLGVLWGFIAAISAGFITPVLRCVLGAMAAGAMYWLGVHQIKQQRAGLGKVLLGGANAVLVLSISAVHLLYGLIPAAAAVALYMVALLAAGWSAIHFRSQTLVVLTVFSGYLVPFLVSHQYANTWLLVGYLLVFSIAMLYLSYRYEYRVAYWFSFAMLHFALLSAGGFRLIESEVPILTAVILQHLALFVVYVAGKQSRAELVTLQFTAFGAVTFWAWLLFMDQTRVVLTLVLIGAILLYAGAATWLVRRGEQLEAPRQGINGAIIALALMLLLLEWVSGDYRTMAVYIEGILLLLLGITYRLKPQLALGSLFSFIAGCILLGSPIRFVVSTETLGWLVILTSLPILYWMLSKKQVLSAQNARLVQILLWVEAVLGLSFLSILTNIVTKDLASDSQHLILSAVWLVYAIAVIILGIGMKKARVRLVGVLFLFLVLLKVIFVDVPDVSLAVRALLFMVLGAAGIGVSRLLYTKKDQE